MEHPAYEEIVAIILDWYCNPKYQDEKLNQILRILWGDKYDELWHEWITA